jgi:hypothetical protein
MRVVEVDMLEEAEGLWLEQRVESLGQGADFPATEMVAVVVEEEVDVDFVSQHVGLGNQRRESGPWSLAICVQVNLAQDSASHAALDALTDLVERVPGELSLRYAEKQPYLDSWLAC